MARATNAGRVAVLLAAAAAAAAVSNLAASTSRKLAWVGNYPRAQQVDAGTPATVPARPASPAPSAEAAPAPVAPSTGTVGAVDPDLARAFPPHPAKAAIEIDDPGVIENLDDPDTYRRAREREERRFAPRDPGTADGETE